LKHRALSLWLALALLAACSPDATAPDDVADPRPPLGDTRRTPITPARSAESRIDAGGIALHAQGERRSDLLARLARLAGFEVMGVPSDDRILSVDSDGAPVESLVAEILVGEPYGLRYWVDEQTGEHRLERVTIGTVQGDLARLRREERLERRRRAAQTRSERRERARKLTPDERQERAAERARERQEREREIESALVADDPTVRARGVGKLDPEEEGELPQLLVFSDDPDPEVRAAAVSRLALGEGRAASEAVFAALDDPDPRVVIDALDGIAFQQDPAASPYVLPLLDHPDETIRTIAAETLKFLE
jgi:hypothetical protein